MQKIIMMDPERTETEGNRSKILIESKVKKDGLVIGGAMGEDFGRG